MTVSTFDKLAGFTRGADSRYDRPRVFALINAFSESQFKTTKYSPAYPERFDDFANAEAWCGTFFHHCNEAHRHSGLASLTPAIVHHGDPAAVLAHRQATMDRAYQQSPFMGSESLSTQGL